MEPLQATHSPRKITVKCLLVDDRPENLLALSALLEDELDVEILQATSGQQALELALQHDLALALLDVQMPEMDGFELAELLRGSERTRHIPLIFVTAGAHNASRMFQGYETGAVDFLFKPIEPSILQMKARVFFDLYRTKRQLAEELAERTETLRLAETFSAILGHDLRSPLSVIQMMATLLQRKSDDPSVQQKAQQIANCGRLMSRMIADILDLSRARLGNGLPIARQSIDAQALIAPLIEHKRTLHPQATITDHYQGDQQVHWDPDRITQLVTNLVNNAARHGNPTEPVEVVVDGGAGHEVVITVRNGGAIAPDILPHVFEPFRRAKNTDSSEGLGLGLGLYIVWEIARSHGGNVTAEATADDHTVMRVRLPRRVD
ncbi:MAG: Bacteriophytochrome [Paracidovorax wautersii]|uniref:histidine kinase n=1 Tax=Paracidovorax wautersii TaxID=1177982 RepID=A0A7V8FS12_9BURK|nr:MAG: Bacteriophytochrome [Paracidovorax wautersii]